MPSVKRRRSPSPEGYAEGELPSRSIRLRTTQLAVAPTGQNVRPTTLRDLPHEVLPLIAGAASEKLGTARLHLTVLMQGAGCTKQESMQYPQQAGAQRTLLEVNPSLMWSIPPRERTLEHYFDFASRQGKTLDGLSEQIPIGGHPQPTQEAEAETEPRWLASQWPKLPGIPTSVPKAQVGLAVRALEVIREGGTWQDTDPSDFYLTVIEHSADVIACMPLIYLNDDFFMQAFDRNPGVIEYFPRRLLTQEVANRALDADPNLLQMIPHDVYPIDHWVAMIGERLDDDDNEAFEDVGVPILREVSHALIERDPSNVLALNTHRATVNINSPGTERARVLAEIAEETNRLAVAREPALLPQIEPALRLESVCLAAVSGDGLLLAHVPEAHSTLQVCEAAVRQNPQAMALVPEALQAQVAAALASPPAQGAAAGAAS